jgi:predicted ATPase
VQRHDAATQLGKMVFFDRSLIDAVSALIYEEPDLAKRYLRMIGEYRYATTVFMTTPWPEHFKNDVERRHTFEDSVAEYDRLVTTYTATGYSIQTLPQVSVLERIDFILKHID